MTTGLLCNILWWLDEAWTWTKQPNASQELQIVLYFLRLPWHPTLWLPSLPHELMGIPNADAWIVLENTYINHIIHLLTFQRCFRIAEIPLSEPDMMPMEPFGRYTVLIRKRISRIEDKITRRRLGQASSCNGWVLHIESKYPYALSNSSFF